MTADARRFNATEQQIAALRGRAEDHAAVWRDNAAIVDAFVVVATQWRVASIGGGFAPARPLFVGLDYAAARICLDAEDIAVTPELWRGLRIMEGAARAALNGN